MHALPLDKHLVLLPILLNRLKFGQGPGVGRETGVALITPGFIKGVCGQVIPFLARLLAPTAADAFRQINQHAFLLV
jgi:hypothetical protein